MSDTAQRHLIVNHENNVEIYEVDLQHVAMCKLISTACEEALSDQTLTPAHALKILQAARK